MITKKAFEATISQRGTLVLDGALATELEVRGHDLSHPLWSGRVLHRDPHAIEQIHLDYFMAGADIAITSTYQTSMRGLQEQLQLSEVDAKSMITRSVELAKSARNTAYASGVSRQRRLLVAGSVGPYGAYLADGSEYRGDYRVSCADIKVFHRERIRALVEADIDLLVLETMPNLEEIEAVLGLLAEEFPTAIALLSCTLKDAQHLSDGTSLQQLFARLNKRLGPVVGFGANCVRPELITAFLRPARMLTDIPLLCYPNSGELYDGGSKTWSGVTSREHLASRAVQEWQSAGAKLIGGCCRTTPNEIHVLAEALHRGVSSP